MDKFFTDQISKEHNVLCVEYKGKNEVKIIISDNDGEHEPKAVVLKIHQAWKLYKVLRNTVRLMQINQNL